MRLYDLKDKSIAQLKQLKDTIAVGDLTFEEKEANIKAIDELLGNRDITSALVETSEIELED